MQRQQSVASNNHHPTLTHSSDCVSSMLFAQLESFAHFPCMHNNDRIEDDGYNCSQNTFKWYAYSANVKLTWYAMGGIV